MDFGPERSQDDDKVRQETSCHRASTRSLSTSPTRATVCPYYVNTGMFDGAESAPLLPILDPAEVVEEAWTATLAGKPFVVLPKTVMLSEMLKGVVPTGVRDFITEHVIGPYHTMDDFTGRS